MLLGTQRVNERGHLEIGGCDTVELAAEYGTPLYVIDEAALRDNCRRYVAAFKARYPGESSVSYAGKAFLVQAAARVIHEEGLELDVASGGELYTALSAGFPAAHILFHGNNKADWEIAMGLDAGVGRFVVDNPWELRRLNAMAAERGVVQSMLLRVTPGIDPHTHRRIRTGQEDSKFGVNISDGTAIEILLEAMGLENVDLRGIHCHIGSQLLETFRDRCGYALVDLDIGGGLGVRYLPSHNPPSYEEFADTICGALTDAYKKYDLVPPRLLQEPGRALVAETGTTLYTIGTTKTVNIPPHADHPTPDNTRDYVSVDGGMSDNPRPQLYDSVYSVLVANRVAQSREKLATIAGKHCETDILLWNAPVGETRPGDILAVQTTGAYNHAMASNYNRFMRPTVVFVRDGAADVVYQRETLDDLLRQDRIPARLAARS
jgi:diaminopimelate decarboxylase